MEKPLKIIIIVLVITAIGLGYLISKRMTAEPDNISQSPPPPVASRSSTPLPASSGISSASRTPNPLPTPSGVSSTPSFTPDEALVLKPPPSGSKDEDIGRYYATVDKLAKDTDTIEIGSSCFASPLVARVKSGAKLTIINKDVYDHSLSFDGPIYVIPSKGTQVITVKLTHGPGVYAYVCDANSPRGKIVGVLKVMP